MTPAKTNAARLLDNLAIPYELLAYEVDETDLTAPSVARKIGLPPEQVFKTLLTQVSTGDHLFTILPGNAELDLKKLARAAGVRNVELASLKEVEPLTGYIRGGVLQLLLTPADYLRATAATLHDLTRAINP